MTHNYQYYQHDPLSHHQVVKTATAVTLGGSLMVLSGLALAATVIGLVVATPVLVIFIPVLVPAFSGFLASGGLGATASFVFYWMYRYVTGKHPLGSRQLDMARDKIAGAASEARHHQA